MARAIAICRGGPLDGQHISVLLDDAGSPTPLESRAEVAGALYLPAGESDLTDEVAASFLHPVGYDDDGTLVVGDTGGFGHEQAYVYLPHAFTVRRDKKGVVTAYVPGAAL